MDMYRQSDAQVLAGVLCVREAAAADMLAARGGVRGVVDSDPQLRAVLELARRYLDERLARGDVMTDPRAVRAYLTVWLRPRDREVFAVLFLDNRHRVMAAEELFQGSIDSAAVHPREVVKRALALNAAAVIVAHNHPSGDPEPSRDDEIITRRLREALALVEVRLLDHFIVGDGDPVSLAERGLV